MTRVAIVVAVLGVGAWALMPRQPSLDALARRALARIDGEVTVPRLRSAVRVVRDEWGIPHISAGSTDDLFFAQGYVAAQDRLWQMELWRRTAEGRLAEIVGPEAVARDRQTRLLKYRGPVDDRELTVYHPEARRLMTAFVNGVNAFIAGHENNLPIEFVLTGIVPEPWTIETLTLRQTTFGDAASELQLARSVARNGVVRANAERNPDPWDALKVPEGFDPSVVDDAVINSTRAGGRNLRPALLPEFRASASGGEAAFEPDAVQPGSNNWVVSGARSATGKPVVANDPHREVTLPSLRYIMHLQAPGWNVIGAAEPPFLGIALGHNDRIAWGLTIVGTDQHDVYVEQLNPDAPDEVRWKNGWEKLRIVREQLRVKGAAPLTIELKFSRHGPIFHEDRTRNIAFALRSALHEPGTAPYLAGLRLSQVNNCREFLDAATYWYAPSENLICGDVDNNISWRASALTPDRKGFTGRLPLPGSGGTHEWSGFRRDLPQSINPPSGVIVTANHNVQPPDYSPPFMYKDADVRFDRITRLRRLLLPDRTFTLDDHRRMQHDAFSLRTADSLHVFREFRSLDADVERARSLLAAWDATYRRDASEPALYETWRAVVATFGGPLIGPDHSRRRVEESLRQAITMLRATQGPDWSKWRWGRMHARAFRHPLVRAFDLPDAERGGGVDTVAADGASYREILDLSDWDKSLVINTPGQSGQPASPFYGNLLRLWADDQYFPLVYSTAAIEAKKQYTMVLRP